ncbi:MoaD/ThiS family protein [Arthrobacter sp. M4]|uniref:MoaD/ThiS family protein n=1 Tax=Arthrobacter sp. M4 TaxID=218160 RepID=UPI001CDBD2E8|nr:MoaD/ThiS family protein [Arthrobacter sp. M4]MCA4134627.1 MoaD/ThiS family protein [Arthrobacter sp. M4]
MLVRYFAAARAAAGVDEERHELGEGATLEELLDAVLAVVRPAPPSGTPSLARIIGRSSFLCNEIAIRDRSVALRSGDVVDVLPPFAGG